MPVNGQEIKRIVGLADSCELAAAVFAFPCKKTAEGLSNGTVTSDVVLCLEDAGVDAATVEAVGEALAEFEGADVNQLHASLRKGHSLMYMAPGLEVPIWPYESAFLLVAKDPEAAPTLFRNACALDVERQMREAGVLPKTARTEPCDSVWDEFSFMSYLYGSLGAALYEDRTQAAAAWRGRIHAFWADHMSKWLPAFISKTVEVAPTLSYGSEYARLAVFGSVVLAALAADIENGR